MTLDGSQKPVLRVFFFGDSICFGQGVSPHRSWVTRTAATLAELGVRFGTEIVVQNPSVCGDTSRIALERMPRDVQAHRPDVLLVQFGMNDCNCWVSDAGAPRVSPRAFAANLEEIIERGFRFGVRHLFLMTNHPSGRNHGPMPGSEITYEAANRRYNAIIRSIAADWKDRVDLLDAEREFESRLDRERPLVRALARDEIHLAELGHDLYYEIVCPPLARLIESELAAGAGTLPAREGREI